MHTNISRLSYAALKFLPLTAEHRIRIKANPNAEPPTPSDKFPATITSVLPVNKVINHKGRYDILVALKLREKETFSKAPRRLLALTSTTSLSNIESR